MIKQSLYRPGQGRWVPGGWDSQISIHQTHEGGMVVSPSHQPPLPPQEIFLILISVRSWVDPRAIARTENSNDIFLNRTRDLPACNAVPQTTASPSAPTSRVGPYIIRQSLHIIRQKEYYTHPYFFSSVFFICHWQQNIYDIKLAVYVEQCCSWTVSTKTSNSAVILNTFAASYLNNQGLNNSYLKSRQLRP